MNAETALAEAYQEWRRLAETEGEAIRAGNWGLLAASQSALHHLRERVTELTAAAKSEWARFGADLRIKEKNFRGMVSELIQIERRNQTLLESIRKSIAQRLDDLDRTTQNLRRVHRSYSTQRPSVWTSFS